MFLSRDHVLVKPDLDVLAENTMHVVLTTSFSLDGIMSELYAEKPLPGAYQKIAGKNN